jgi:LacI family transcriptional regulator
MLALHARSKQHRMFRGSTPPGGEDLSEPITAVQPGRAPGAQTPRVLVLLGTHGAWSRGVLRGFMATAREHDWTLLHYDPSADLSWVMREFAPAVAVVGPELSAEQLSQLAPASLISVSIDRSAAGIPSVCLDQASIAKLALEHLLARGLRHVSTFRFDASPFAMARERAFIEYARAAGVRVSSGWGSDEAYPAQRREDAAAMLAWLRGLGKPCGIFTITDGWARTVSRYARIGGLRVPEDLALIGADNDVLECELMSPALSSVMIPWREAGARAAKLVQRALSGQTIHGERVLIAPLQVIARRSSDVLAIDDELVAEAVQWIQANAGQRLTVPMVARAIGGGRQRIERRFRRVLDRTVAEEIRRAHVDLARTLLESTQAPLPEVAKRSGFTNAALLSVAFQREIGMPPGIFRRRVRLERGSANGS